MRALRELVLEKGAQDVVIVDLRKVDSEISAFLVCHGNSKRQVKAISVEVKVKLPEFGFSFYSMEGLAESNWVLIDCGDIVVHIFVDEYRETYRLEKLWSNTMVIV
ncbi:MAG: ribosome silencing factor [Nitrospinota bacterium]|nr:ribosome silencing factor [Nitrospinota bacterium]